jgi:dUTP pyrophosphatase
MKPIELKIKRLHHDARLPTYGSDGAAAFDLYAINDGTVPAGAAAVLRTGLAFEVPPGQVLKIYSRSGHGFKNGVLLVNAVGVIDADYRGEVMIGLQNNGFIYFDVKAGDRIAQAMLEPAPRVAFIEVDELSDTVRGAGGFGSTGA